MKESIKTWNWIPTVVAVALVAPVMAFASHPPSAIENVRVSVSYADLNLNRSADVEQLYRRLKSAADDVCGSTSIYEAGSTRQVSENKACARGALDRAVQKVDNAALTKLHTG